MSFRHMSIVWEMDIHDPTRKLLLMGIASYANEDGECWPSQETLAVRIGCSTRTIRTHLAALEAAGWLTREARSSLRGRRSDFYTLHLPALQPERYSRPASGSLRCTQPEEVSGSSSLIESTRENKGEQTKAPHNKKPKQAFTPPTEQEWLDHCQKTYPTWKRQAASSAWAYYESIGWRTKVGPIKNWKACAQTCKARARPNELETQRYATPDELKAYNEDFE